MRVAPREAGDAGIYLLYKLYLAPFDALQIRQWTRRRFGLLRSLAGYRARGLIRKIPELAVRPFLLTALPDLIRDHEKVENIFELYSYMVKKWLIREERWIQSTILEDFSRRVAVDIYLNRERRKAERLPFEELTRHFDVSIPEDGWKFKSRSLLNRDSEGNFKFAHRSIMEFVFVDAYLRGDVSCLTVIWTDFMVELFWKAVESSLENHRTPTLRESIFVKEDLRTARILKDGLRLGSLNNWSSDIDVERLGRSEQYAGLFIRIGVVGETLAICDLLKSHIYAFSIGAKSGEDLQTFAVNTREVESLAVTWANGENLGLQHWRMVTGTELLRLFRFKAIRDRFRPHGIRIWSKLDDGKRLGVVNIDCMSGRDDVTPVPTWKERLQSDPLLRENEISGVMVQVADTDAEEFYFNCVRRLQ